MTPIVVRFDPPMPDPTRTDREWQSVSFRRTWRDGLLLAVSGGCYGKPGERWSHGADRRVVPDEVGRAAMAFAPEQLRLAAEQLRGLAANDDIRAAWAEEQVRAFERGGAS